MNQLLSLASIPPGNIFYHLITLFAAQAVFAIAYSFWQQHTDDAFTRRLSWAAAGVVGARLLLLLASIIVSDNSTLAVVILPPLETAVNTATAVLLIWSFLPQTTNNTPLSNTALVIALSIVGILLLFSIPVWQRQISEGTDNYLRTLLVALWSLLQITMIVGGLVFVLRNQATRQSLRPFILVVLLAAQCLQLWNTTNFNAFDSNITYWVRLGMLIALPLWAVFAYQYVISSFNAVTKQQATAVHKFSQTFHQAAAIIAVPRAQQRINHSLNLATYLLDASFVAIGLPSEQPQELKFVSNLPAVHPSSGRRWKMNLTNWTTFRLAAAQAQLVELQPDGLGAQQLRDFYGTLGLESQGAILAHPLQVHGQQIGLLLIVGPPERSSWSAESRLLLPGLAVFMAQAIANSLRRPTTAVAPATPQEIVALEVHQRQQEKLHLTKKERNNLQAKLVALQTQAQETAFERDQLKMQLAKAQAHILAVEEETANLKARARKVAATIADAKKQALYVNDPPPRIQFIAPPPQPKQDSEISL